MWKAAALIAFALTVVAFGIGWWMPNAVAWKDCGASSGFAIARGVWEKPDLLACSGLMLAQ
jgi:hypothetical protein